MTTSQFRETLLSRITDAEAAALRQGEGLYISEYNRGVCLRLLEDELPAEGEVPTDQAAALEEQLGDYLRQYMPEAPEGHKWIILACLYLTFAARLPMHPPSAAGWVERQGRYFCPAMEPDSFICGCCRCEKMDSAP